MTPSDSWVGIKSLMQDPRSGRRGRTRARAFLDPAKKLLNHKNTNAAHKHKHKRRHFNGSGRDQGRMFLFLLCTCTSQCFDMDFHVAPSDFELPAMMQHAACYCYFCYYHYHYDHHGDMATRFQQYILERSTTVLTGQLASSAGGRSK